MARRLDPATRRAEIVAAARALIAEDGPRALSLRAVARRCEMSAPGLMHHFPTMSALLDTVLTQRESENMAAIGAILAARPTVTLLDLADTLVRYYADPIRLAETRGFEALEAEAMVPGHPAHAYYQRSTEGRPWPLTVALAAREYAEPEGVATIMSLVADGMRLRWLQCPDAADRWADWAAVRDSVFASFVRRVDAAPPAPLSDIC